MAQLIETMNVEHLSGTDYIRSKKKVVLSDCNGYNWGT